LRTDLAQGTVKMFVCTIYVPAIKEGAP
jgi:hypothetical protein